MVPTAAVATSTPTPRPTPPVQPRGRVAMSLMQDTQWQADGVAIHSGQPGPRIMVLGGVHGNEPGGWLAAEAISGWDVQRGSLLVFPRVNWRSAAAFERTLPGYGDLNRAYPGDQNSTQPMVRMAAAVVYLLLTAGMMFMERSEIGAIWRSARTTLEETNAAVRERHSARE